MDRTIERGEVVMMAKIKGYAQIAKLILVKAQKVMDLVKVALDIVSEMDVETKQDKYDKLIEVLNAMEEIEVVIGQIKEEMKH